MKERDMSNEIRYKCEQPQRNHGKKSHQITQGDYTCLDGDKQWTGMMSFVNSLNLFSELINVYADPKCFLQ